MLEYGDFLQQQPELMALAQQLGRSREAKSVPSQEAPLETFHQLVREPNAVPEEVSGITRATTYCACCRRSWRPSASATWNWSFIAAW
nr:VWA domain protein interacting with AAA ATPase [Candidatus Pantoea persica]